MPKPDLKAIVAKEHTLVDKMAKFKLQELRLIAFCLAHYDSRKADNREIQASVEDMRSIYPSMDRKSAYMIIRETFNRLGSKPLEFEENGELIYWHWFSGFKYKKGEATFKFYINPELQPYLLDLKGTFTRYRLQDVYQFRSATTWKLYEHLKKLWEFQNNWSISLDELKVKLGIPGKYDRWNNFRDVVIDPAIRDINTYSDITVTYEKEKHVRTIVGLVFFVDDRQPDDVITFENPKQQVYRLLLDCNVNEKTATTYAEKIESYGKTSLMVTLIPKIKGRWENAHKSNRVPLQKYLLGSINKEIHEPKLFEDPPEKTQRPDHAEALDCWTEKRHKREKCPVRVRGQAGQRGKCKQCLEKIPVADFGI